MEEFHDQYDKNEKEMDALLESHPEFFKVAYFPIVEKSNDDFLTERISVDKIGGRKPHLTKEWPVCECCEFDMKFWFQLTDPISQKTVQLFMCPCYWEKDEGYFDSEWSFEIRSISYLDPLIEIPTELVRPKKPHPLNEVLAMLPEDREIYNEVISYSLCFMEYLHIYLNQQRTYQEILDSWNYYQLHYVSGYQQSRHLLPKDIIIKQCPDQYNWDEYFDEHDREGSIVFYGVHENRHYHNYSIDHLIKLTCTEYIPDWDHQRSDFIRDTLLIYSDGRMINDNIC